MLTDFEYGSIQNVHVVGERIYFSSYTKIYAMNIDGTDMQQLVDDAYGGGLNVSGGRLYYSAGKAIISLNTDGTERREIELDENPLNVIVVDGRIYYCASTGIIVDEITGTTSYALFSMRSDGSDRQEIVSDVRSFFNVDGNRVYFTGMDGNLYSIGTDGTDQQMIYEGIGREYCGVMGGRIYFSFRNMDMDSPDYLKTKLYSIKTDGTDGRFVED
jgi:outer membrane protein assembly factor BamB